MIIKQITAEQARANNENYIRQLKEIGDKEYQDCLPLPMVQDKINEITNKIGKLSKNSDIDYYREVFVLREDIKLSLIDILLILIAIAFFSLPISLLVVFVLAVIKLLLTNFDMWVNDYQQYVYIIAYIISYCGICLFAFIKRITKGNKLLSMQEWQSVCRYLKDELHYQANIDELKHYGTIVRHRINIYW